MCYIAGSQKYDSISTNIQGCTYSKYDFMLRNTTPYAIYIYVYIYALSPLSLSLSLYIYIYIYSATVNVISYILSIIEIWSTSPHTKTSLGLIIILYLLDILCSTVRLKMYLSVHQWSIHRSVFYPMYCQVSILLCGTAEIPIYSVVSINSLRPSDAYMRW